MGLRELKRSEGREKYQSAELTSSKSLLAHLLVDDVWIFIVLFRRNPHLQNEEEREISAHNQNVFSLPVKLTFLNVFNPAKILPPIQVEYFRSGGAQILIFNSSPALTSRLVS